MVKLSTTNVPSSFFPLSLSFSPFPPFLPLPFPPLPLSSLPLPPSPFPPLPLSPPPPFPPSLPPSPLLTPSLSPPPLSGAYLQRRHTSGRVWSPGSWDQVNLLMKSWECPGEKGVSAWTSLTKVPNSLGSLTSADDCRILLLVELF